MAANVPSNGLSSVSPAASGPQTASAPRSIWAHGTGAGVSRTTLISQSGPTVARSRSEPTAAHSRPTGPGLPVNMTQPGILPRDHPPVHRTYGPKIQSISTLQVTRS